MTIVQGVALLAAAIVAGALNSVAGGGSFISFPTLLFTGVPSIAANATNTVALWPGALASIPPYRKDLTHERRALVIFSLVSVVGGVLGAVILLHTPQKLFERMIPWLLLIATLIFAFGNNAAQWLRRRRSDHAAVKPDPAQDAPASAAASSKESAGDIEDLGDLKGIAPGALIVVLVIQFAISLYGGFFGGGIGIMMLAGFALLGMRDIHAMNALKVVLASIINGVAIIAFAIAGQIYWAQGLLMVVGSVIGGYGGAALAHRVPPQYVRWFAIAVGLVVSAYLFLFYKPAA